MPRVPTWEEREEAAAEVRFEFWALRQALRGSVAGLEDPSGWAPGAFAVECCLLHVRNVVDFLYPRTRIHRDDIVADHFTAGRWSAERPDPGAVRLAGMTLDRVRRRLDKELAHLTYSRIHTRDEQLWEHVVPLAEDALAYVRRFADSLDEPERSWFAADPDSTLPWIVESQLNRDVADSSA